MKPHVALFILLVANIVLQIVIYMHHHRPLPPPPTPLVCNAPVQCQWDDNQHAVLVRVAP
ncbi:hypothetical protein [Mycolicibacterium sphagni]|uniref:hypothetical protein n=1 Tax=Mycolicibacterium sphagni TaxID=1786 RepID=UPI0021F39EC6|nr:hypothetical protein [Mycolicibacterium sphagni]MCV7174757.1 hypothetical protein [Mycolicibacterium sphagni]